MNWVQMTRKNYFDDDDDASTDPCYYQKYKILATKKLVLVNNSFKNGVKPVFC